MKPARTHTAIALAVAAAAGLDLPVATSAYANPNGAEVVHGQATLGTNAAGQLEIGNIDGTIINWREFSIGADEATRFIQPSAQSAVLNRVVGRNPSEILGQLSSNGRVFLINPNGMVFGPGAKIDTAGFVASTLDITDADFLAGRLQFEGTGGRIDNASIQNWGMIQAGPGGEIVLIAPQVKNEGVLSVVGGQLILAAGQKVRLSSLNIDDVTIEVSAPGNQALNLGRLIAERGAVGMLGAGVINRGRIEANSLSRDAQGRIVLSASESLELGTGSVLDASGVLGGDIRLSASDTALVRGSLGATGSDGLGGNIDISAANTGVFGDVRIDASGGGGGNGRSGGGYQGRDADIANATHTVVNSGARIAADALAAGDGGTVTAWADGSTRFGGAISARGGAAGGNGGFVEVSGHELLGFDGRVDVGAAAGSSGQILLDPNNLTITASTTTNNGELADGTILFGDGGAADFTVSEAALEALTGSIELQAQQVLTIASGATLNLTNQTAGESVALRAGSTLRVNGGIFTNGADLLLSAGDVGAMTPDASAALLLAGGTLSTGNGDLQLSAGSGGISLTSGTVTLGTGTLGFSTAGAIIAAGTTFNGGVLDAMGTTTRLIATGSSTLNGVTLDMDLALAGGQDLFVTNDLSQRG